MTINGDGVVMRKMDIFLSQSDNAYNSQLLCIENAKNRVLRRISLATFSTYFLHSGKRLEMVSCYGCGYIVKQSICFLSDIPSMYH